MDFLTDTNYWGIIIVPVGLVLGFGAPLIVWLKDECTGGSAKNPKQKR